MEAWNMPALVAIARRKNVAMRGLMHVEIVLNSLVSNCEATKAKTMRSA